MQMRPIQPNDNPALQSIIETVMPEFGANGPGFAIEDPEVKDMFSFYSQPGRFYWVIEDEGQLVAGAGISALNGSSVLICELQKMYMLKMARGRGLGQQLLDLCLQGAKELGYESCYIETLDIMQAARKLYERNGFTKRKGPLGNTGHFGCNCFYEKSLL
ncbi:MAG: GNAT family N-acetyltransferase [Bdellovibrionales bacterium]|nr:GNAT family N-acetyltransferase [Bdellovibrionales bacterium]